MTGAMFVLEIICLFSIELYLGPGCGYAELGEDIRAFHGCDLWREMRTARSPLID